MEYIFNNSRSIGTVLSTLQQLSIHRSQTQTKCLKLKITQSQYLFPGILLTKIQTDKNIHDFPILPSNALQRPLTISLRGSKLKSYLNSNAELNSSAMCEHSLILIQQSNHGQDNCSMSLFCIHLRFYMSTGTKPFTVLYHKHIISISVFASPNCLNSQTEKLTQGRAS